MDFDALEHAITPRTRGIVVVNPNNPTGSFLKRAELDILDALAAKHAGDAGCGLGRAQEIEPVDAAGGVTT